MVTITKPLRNRTPPLPQRHDRWDALRPRVRAEGEAVAGAGAGVRGRGGARLHHHGRPRLHAPSGDRAPAALPGLYGHHRHRLPRLAAALTKI